MRGQRVFLPPTYVKSKCSEFKGGLSDTSKSKNGMTPRMPHPQPPTLGSPVGRPSGLPLLPRVGWLHRGGEGWGVESVCSGQAMLLYHPRGGRSNGPYADSFLLPCHFQGGGGGLRGQLEGGGGGLEWPSHRADNLEVQM